MTAHRAKGLEWAVESGAVRNESDAAAWIGGLLEWSLARFEAPLLLAHCQAAASVDWGQLRSLAEQQRASRETPHATKYPSTIRSHRPCMPQP